MPTSLEVVNDYYEATNNKKDPDAAAALLREDFVFAGPLMKVEGKEANIELLKRFLPMHRETRMHKQFVEGEHVCSIYDLVVSNPAGGTITMPIADWMRVEDGKVAEQTIYYDPREFSKAFGV